MSDQSVANDQALRQALKAVHSMYIKQQIGMLKALKVEFGPRVVEIIRETSSREMCQVYRDLADRMGKNSIDDLINVLWEPLREKGYMFTLKKTETGVQVNCTACPFASMYRSLGGEEWGYALFCAIDEDLTKAYNPEIGFKRTKTLMEGHAICDHYYFIK